MRGEGLPVTGNFHCEELCSQQILPSSSSSSGLYSSCNLSLHGLQLGHARREIIVFLSPLKDETWELQATLVNLGSIQGRWDGRRGWDNKTKDLIKALQSFAKQISSKNRIMAGQLCSSEECVCSQYSPMLCAEVFKYLLRSVSNNYICVSKNSGTSPAITLESEHYLFLK